MKEQDKTCSNCIEANGHICEHNKRYLEYHTEDSLCINKSEWRLRKNKIDNREFVWHLGCLIPNKNYGKLL